MKKRKKEEVTEVQEPEPAAEVRAPETEPWPVIWEPDAEPQAKEEFSEPASAPVPEPEHKTVEPKEPKKQKEPKPPRKPLTEFARKILLASGVVLTFLFLVVPRTGLFFRWGFLLTVRNPATIVWFFLAFACGVSVFFNILHAVRLKTAGDTEGFDTAYLFTIIACAWAWGWVLYNLVDAIWSGFHWTQAFYLAGLACSAFVFVYNIFDKRKRTLQYATSMSIILPSPAILLLLSFTTLGVYNYIWAYRVSRIIIEKTGGSDFSRVYVMCLIFIPLYKAYWVYIQSKKLAQVSGKDDSALLLAISLFFLFRPVALAMLNEAAASLSIASEQLRIED